MHRDVRLFMNDIHKHLSARQDDIKLLLTFADQSLIICFAGLDLAATNSNKSPLALCAGRRRS